MHISGMNSTSNSQLIKFSIHACMYIYLPHDIRVYTYVHI